MNNINDLKLETDPSNVLLYTLAKQLEAQFNNQEDGMHAELGAVYKGKAGQRIAPVTLKMKGKQTEFRLILEADPWKTLE